jgi:hypothetical protein
MKMERQSLVEELEEVLAIGRHISDVGDLIRGLTSAALLIEGFHTHRGQWRRQRVAK